MRSWCNRLFGKSRRSTKVRNTAKQSRWNKWRPLLEPLEVRTAPAIAYVVPNLPTPGNQSFGGSLGMDFDINAPITITQLGVFDDNGDGLSAFTIITPLTVRLFNRDTQLQV